MQTLWSVRLKWTHTWVSIGQVAGNSTASAAPFIFAAVKASSGLLQDAMTTVQKTLVHLTLISRDK